MTEPIVLITSASGRKGKELVTLPSQDRTFKVRACCFSQSKAASLKASGADEVVEFDLNNAAKWDAALDGVSGAYSAPPDPMLEGHLAFCKALGNCSDQIKQVVRISCMGADTNTASYNPEKHSSRKDAAIPLMLQYYWWGEKALFDEGLSVSMLRNNFFMNHLLKTGCETNDSEGWFSNPSGAAKNSFVAIRDIATASAVIPIEGPEKYKNKFYDLTTQGACGETGLDELWQGNLWKNGEDAMMQATELKG